MHGRNHNNEQEGTRKVPYLKARLGVHSLMAGTQPQLGLAKVAPFLH